MVAPVEVNALNCTNHNVNGLSAIHFIMVLFGLMYFTGQGVLLDRSVFSDAVFAEVNYQQGTISPEGAKFLFILKN